MLLIVVYQHFKKGGNEKAMYVWVELEGEEAEKFLKIQDSLGLKARSEVLRFLVKRYRVPKVSESGG